MQTFRYLVVLGVGTVLTLSSINRGIAQPQDPLPQQQADSYRHTDPLLSETSGSHSTHRRGGSSAINLAQSGAPSAQLPPVDPASPSPTPTTPLPATPTPSPTPPAPSPSPTIPSQEELNRLNPSPDLLETPTDPDAVRLPATPQPITLQQALELARRNNRDLQVAEVTLRRDRAALREAQAALLPTVSAQTNLTRQSPGASGGGNVLTDPTTGQSFNQGGGTSTALSGTVQAGYDIFTSGRRPATIRRQEEQARFSELEVERLTEQLRLDVSNDYYDVQESDAQVRINQAAVDNSRASLRDAQALERAGLGTRFDVLQAQVQLANDIQQLTDSLSQQRIARRQLVQRLSLGSSVDVSAADPIAVAPRWTLSLEESTVLAFQNRAELGQQLAQRNISEQNRRIALADLGPQVSFVVGYNPQYILENNSGGEGFTGFIDDFTIGPQVTLNIFDGGAARARATQEEANIRIAETNFANTRNQVRFAVEQAFFSLDSSFANIATASTAVDQARESLRLARLRFQAGVGIQSDVLDAVAALAQAEGNRVTAILGYNRALVSLQREISNLQVTAP